MWCHLRTACRREREASFMLDVVAARGNALVVGLCRFGSGFPRPILARRPDWRDTQRRTQAGCSSYCARQWPDRRQVASDLGMSFQRSTSSSRLSPGAPQRTPNIAGSRPDTFFAPASPPLRYGSRSPRSDSSTPPVGEESAATEDAGSSRSGRCSRPGFGPR